MPNETVLMPETAKTRKPPISSDSESHLEFLPVGFALGNPVSKIEASTIPRRLDTRELQVKKISLNF